MRRILPAMLLICMARVWAQDLPRPPVTVPGGINTAISAVAGVDQLYRMYQNPDAPFAREVRDHLRDRYGEMGDMAAFAAWIAFTGTGFGEWAADGAASIIAGSHRQRAEFADATEEAARMFVKLAIKNSMNLNDQDSLFLNVMTRIHGRRPQSSSGNDNGGYKSDSRGSHNSNGRSGAQNASGPDTRRGGRDRDPAQPAAEQPQESQQAEEPQPTKDDTPTDNSSEGTTRSVEGRVTDGDFGATYISPDGESRPLQKGLPIDGSEGGRGHDVGISGKFKKTPNSTSLEHTVRVVAPLTEGELKLVKKKKGPDGDERPQIERTVTPIPQNRDGLAEPGNLGSIGQGGMIDAKAKDRLPPVRDVASQPIKH